ncbi:MAG: hypothetical protein ACOX88_05185 [Christensenellales bacterium]|jgi:hypothetical protein
MKTIFKSAFKQILLSPIISLVLVVQVLLCANIFVRVTGVIQDRLLQFEMVKSSFSGRTYITSTKPGLTRYDGTDNSLEEYNNAVDRFCAELSQISGVEQVIPPAKSWLGMDITLDGLPLPDMRVTTYNNALTDTLVTPLSQGSFWDTSREYRHDEEIPIVVGYELKDMLSVGEAYTLQLQYDRQSDEPDLTLHVRVVGALHERNFSWYLSMIDYTLIEGISFDNTDILMPKLQLPQGQEPYYYQASGGIMLLEENVSTESFTQQMLEDLRNKGYDAQSVDKIIKDDRDRLLGSIANDLVMFIFLFIVSTTGIGGNNGLIRNQVSKYYGVAYIGGATWRQCVAIDVV